MELLILKSKLSNFVREKSVLFLVMQEEHLICAGNILLDQRRAIEMVEASGVDCAITIPHISAAFKDLFSSPVLQALTHLTFFQRLFMASVFRRIRKTGCDQVDYGDVVEEVQDLCVLQGQKAPNHAQTVGICAFLSQYRLLLAEASKTGHPAQKIQLNINQQDLQTYIGDCGDAFLVNLFKNASH